ncbi:putative GPR1/FUN34/yaaH family [Trypanosoma grayi]|uniref:putative GPR1/FUN34/yaaH family n=1 Tax=Trypanosoma grayi TaxID=71804 RepID=UPI0004F48CF4|nr:putative GPR1/FUN34/yaaH family [Trypanosoma grayi]KEG10992.1 putative GPR1/FUN34/yaaH family [Trypanosoma grayi]
MTSVQMENKPLDESPSQCTLSIASGAAENFQTKLADPGPLGLIAFGMTTILFNLTNARIFQMNTTTAGMVVCYGGSTQILVGIMEFIRGNAFNCTITTTFGAFWLATACVWLLPRRTLETPTEYLEEAERGFMGIFFFMWAVFTFFMFASAFRQPLAIMFVLFTAATNFTIQAISFWSDSETIMKIAGYEGLICGMSALYCGLALTMNGSYDRTILPLSFPNRQHSD